MKKLVLFCMLSVIVASWAAPAAQALAPFKKAFQQKYIDSNDNDDLKAAFRKASCNTCHVKGKKKEVRNDYGEELAKLIQGDANQRIKDAGKNGAAARKAETEKLLGELEKAFQEVEKVSTADGGTYADRIKAGKLPFEQ